MEEIQITDNGEVDVQIAPIGDFNGSDTNGNPVPETLTQEGLDELASKLNERGEDVLVDTDHSSCRVGLDRNTQAAGWISKFWTNVKGLFGKMRLTKSGRELVENREYRFLSPTFSLDQNGRPVELHSVALTNTPAFQGSITPIINHAAKLEDVEKANETSNTTETIIMNMTKEELVSLIKETVVAMNTSPVGVSQDETKDSDKSEEVSQDETKEKPVENPATTQNACGEKTEEVKNEETPTSEAPTEEKPSKNEEDDTDDKEDDEEESDKSEDSETSSEVIKLEALNSAPAPKAPQDAEWKFLRGQRFFDYLKQHPELTH